MVGDFLHRETLKSTALGRQDPDKINIYSDIDGSKISAVIEIPFILLECSYIRFELRR